MDNLKINKKNENDFASNLIVVLSNSPSNTLKMSIFMINNGFTVIFLNPKLTSKKIMQNLESVGCYKAIVDENIHIDNDNGLITKSFRDFPEVMSLDLNHSLIQDIFRAIDNNLSRKSSVIFTSGSTGKNKAVLHTLANHCFSAKGSNNNIRFAKGDKWLIALPIYHISGLSIIFRAALSGGNIALKDPNMDILDSLKINKPSHISLVPHQLDDLLNLGEAIDILRNMKAVLLGGSGVPFPLVEESFKAGINIFVSYGSSEMCSQISCTKNRDTIIHLKTSGKILDFRDVRINKNGKIEVRGSTLFEGYLERNKNGEMSIIRKTDGQGYFDTGDTGFIDEEGYLHVTGRSDLVFKYKSEKIVPEEIEKVFLGIEGIREAVVVPYKRNDMLLVPVVFLKADRYDEYYIEHIKNRIKEELEPYKIPDFFLKWPYDSDKLKPSRSEMKKIAKERISGGIKDIF